MKIIKHGIKRESEVSEYKLECSNCGCKFEFSHEEIEKQEKRLNGNAWIHCPDCNFEIEFKPSEHFYGEENEKENQEIYKCLEMVKQANIPHEFTNFYDGWQIIIFNKDGYRLCDCVCHSGSYGNENGLLEIMFGSFTGDVEGWLTAEEVFKRFKYCYEHDTNVYVKEEKENETQNKA